jgi:hypothetical protein
MSTKKQKYVLFKSDGGDDHLPKPCAFFGSAEGCRKGSTCPFVHGGSAAPSAVQSAPVSTKRAAVEEIEVKSEFKKARKSTEGEEVAVVNTAPIVRSEVAARVVPESKTAKKNSEVNEVASSNPAPAPVAQVVLPPKVQTPQTSYSAANAKKFDFEAFKEKQKEKHTKQRVAKSPFRPLMAPAEPVVRVQTSSASTTAIAKSVAVPVASFHASPSGVSRAPVASSAPITASSSSLAVAAVDEDDEDAEDTQFLFKAVDIALRGTSSSVWDAPAAFHVKPPQTALLGPSALSTAPAIPSVAVSAHPNPFLPKEAVVQALHTSGTQGKVRRNSLEKEVEASAVVPLPTITTTAPSPSVPPSVSLEYGSMHPLVAATQAHPRFASDYNFAVDSTWVQSQPYGDWCDGFPQVIALDCEMCVTQDPVTLVKDAYTLIRFSVVKGFEGSDVRHCTAYLWYHLRSSHN